jgi:hypothetical protein
LHISFKFVIASADSIKARILIGFEEEEEEGLEG